jgi:hypothetical protein
MEGRLIVGPLKTRATVETFPLPQIVIDALKPRIAGRAPREHAVTSPNGGFLRPEQVVRAHPLVPSASENPIGAFDNSRPTPHLRQPGPGLRR